MDWKEFSVEITKAVAWPVTIGFSLHLFRDGISSVVPRILKIKHNNTEIEFDRLMQAIERTAENIPEATKSKPSSFDKERTRLTNMAIHSPRSTVIQAFAMSDRTRTDLLTQSGLLPSDHRITKGMGYGALRKLGFNEDTIRSFRNLRNVAAKTMLEDKITLSTEGIFSYIDVAIDLAIQFKNKQHE